MVVLCGFLFIVHVRLQRDCIEDDGDVSITYPNLAKKKRGNKGTCIDGDHDFYLLYTHIRNCSELKTNIEKKK